MIWAWTWSFHQDVVWVTCKAICFCIHWIPYWVVCLAQVVLDGILKTVLHKLQRHLKANTELELCGHRSGILQICRSLGSTIFTSHIVMKDRWKGKRFFCARVFMGFAKEPISTQSTSSLLMLKQNTLFSNDNGRQYGLPHIFHSKFADTPILVPPAVA